jgi:hypothetical protein
LVIFALLFGFELFGILGSLMALPVAAVVRETVVYLRRHLVLEPWGTMSPLEVAGVRAGQRPLCSECGSELGPADAFCRACGAEVSGTQVPSGR